MAFRWNRLENLLREGSKSDDYDASGVIPPLIELAIGEDKPGEAKNTLRPLIETETVRVLEAILLEHGARFRQVGRPRAHRERTSGPIAQTSAARGR